jgi:phosphoserine phosphatase
MPEPRPSAATLAAWRTAQAVCFDVDSTVSPDEGIDVLAEHAGVAERVAELTKRAMGGTVPFHEALQARLELIRPSRSLVDGCLRAHPPRLTPGIAELVAALRARATPVFLVTGGFEPMVLPLARQLGIPAERVFANRLLFKADGSFAGFDDSRPTARAGGKAAALASLKRSFGFAPLVMIGDGATDLEARPPADIFIGYGGVVARDKVRDGADWFVADFADLVMALG